MRAYVTYLANDLFLEGAIALKRSLDIHRCSYRAICMVTDEVSESSRKQLEDAGYKLSEAEWIESTRTDFQDRYRDNNRLMFTKLNMFRLPYETIAYLDADVVACENIDGIFDFGVPAAVYDSRALDPSNRGINAGVMVVSPSEQTFRDLVSQIDDYGGYTDQTLMQQAMEFSHLPQEYNALFKQLGLIGRIKCLWKRPKIIHYNGQKPWMDSGPYRWRKIRWFDGAFREYMKYADLSD